MSGIKWIQLFFILLLGVDKTHLQYSVDLYRRSGDTVNLRCKNTLPDDPGCKTTTWIYEKKGDSTPGVVAKNGLIHINKLNPKSKADRMKLESNCSLTVKDITAEDAGRYTCQPSGRKEHKFDLSVLSNTRGNRGTKQTLTCSLFQYDDSCVSLSWLDKDGTLIKDSSGCSATLTINNNLMKVRCQLTVNDKVQTFIDFPGDLKTTQTTNPPTGTPPRSTTASSIQQTPAPDQNESGVAIVRVIVGVVVVVVMATTALVVVFVVKKNMPTNDIPLSLTN